ncbi:MAG: response regulator [Butyrivibrio sp.]|nr:response regulator [Butyrivibrio sp.]
METHTSHTDRIHNIVLMIITIACLGTTVASITQGWEFWVPPLILIGVAGAWFIHITHQINTYFRENYYLILYMLVSFYHGIHKDSFEDIAPIMMVLMAIIAIIVRKRVLIFAVIEFFMLFIVHLYLQANSGEEIVRSVYFTRVSLHTLTVLCAYRAFSEIINIELRNREETNDRNEIEKEEKSEMEDFLVNISHELRTPVNVINGLTSIILKREEREDIESIRDAGRRLSRQIDDIQDYSEIERGDVALEIDKYMITSLINDVIADYKARWKKRSLELVVDLDPDVPSVMNGDVRKLGKIMRHLLSNATKFTKKGGVYLHISGGRRDYGYNLLIEIKDTGCGMKSSDIERVSKGSYQIDRRRNRSTGGIGLGLPIVYGFVRKMNGFVSIESEPGQGTTVRVSIVQEVINPQPCLRVENSRFINIAYHFNPEKFQVSKVREFYRQMATNLAAGLRVNLYTATGIKEMKKLMDAGNITHIFMGNEEYKANKEYFDELADKGCVVTVSAPGDFKAPPDSKIVLIPKPLYGYSIVRILSGESKEALDLRDDIHSVPVLNGVRALVVDDEPMNLVVANGLFKEYNMIIDTAGSGREAIAKFAENDYDVVFMDHMMPEMDGIEAMKQIRSLANQQYKSICIIALTANAISGAREMFLREGFDGFISKPIDINEFERVMTSVMPDSNRKHRTGGIA